MMGGQADPARDYSEYFVALMTAAGAFVVFSKPALIPLGLSYVGLSVWLLVTSLRNRRRLQGLKYAGPRWRVWVFISLWYLVGPIVGAVVSQRFPNEVDGWAAGLGAWWVCIILGYLLTHRGPYENTGSDPEWPAGTDTTPFE